MISFDKLEALGIRPIYENYHPLAAEEFAEISNMLGMPLPQDYRELVTTYGCSYFPGRQVVVRCIEQPSPDISDDNLLPISSLFGGGRQKHRLMQQIHLYRGRVPRNMIPIASDYSGNLYCLSIGGRNAGTVFFWDSGREQSPTDAAEQEMLTPDMTSVSNLTRVATSLADFVGRLEVVSSD